MAWMGTIKKTYLCAVTAVSKKFLFKKEDYRMLILSGVNLQPIMTSYSHQLIDLLRQTNHGVFIMKYLNIQHKHSPTDVFSPAYSVEYLKHPVHPLVPSALTGGLTCNFLTRSSSLGRSIKSSMFTSSGISSSWSQHRDTVQWWSTAS